MNKIKLFMIVLSAFFFTNLNAQIMIGPKLGLNLDRTSFKIPSGSDYKKASYMRFHLGATANFAINDMFSIQPELLYSGKGEKYPDNNDSYIEKWNYNYLEIPILVKATFGKKNLKGFVNLGPYFGYMMSGKYSYKTVNESLKFDENPGTNSDGSTYTSKQNRLDLGLVFGAGVLYKLGPGSLIGEIRYDLGLSNLIKYTGTKPSDPDKSKNRVFAISVGYLFTIGK